MRTTQLALCAAILCAAIPLTARAQGSAMEQMRQTDLLRDMLRAQQSIANELQTLNKTLRRIECIERYRFQSALHCAEGAQTQNEWSL